jgi:hypothetical protein
MRFMAPEGSESHSIGARVEQVARVAGVTPDELLYMCQEIDPEYVPVQAWIPDSMVRELLANVEPTESLESLVELVTKAFAAARRSGKADWQLMGLPVLKNRLLAESPSFDETHFGFPNLHYLAHQLPSILDVSHTRPHITVAFHGDLPQEELPETIPEAIGEEPESRRIRSDLWNAIVDYRSGRVYGWDAESGLARELESGDSLKILPTATKEDLADWRSKFAASVIDGASKEHLAAIQNWVTQNSSTMSLPPKYRGRWNFFLKDQVSERLEEFYRTQGIDAPSDVFVPRSVDGVAGTRSQSVPLRTWLHELIDSMTDDELTCVTFPAGILFRTDSSRR